MTAAAMSRTLGVSRERVRQLLLELGLPTTTSRSDSRGMMRTVRANGLPPRTVGTVAEMVVAADLMARGAKVFWPLQHTPSCDLVALWDYGRRIERVEVRSGKREGKRLLYNQTTTPDKHDRLAVVCQDAEISYLPEF